MVTSLRLALVCMTIVAYVGAQNTTSSAAGNSTIANPIVNSTAVSTSTSLPAAIGNGTSSNTNTTTTSSPPAVGNGTSSSLNTTISTTTSSSPPAVGNGTSSNLNTTTTTTSFPPAVGNSTSSSETGNSTADANTSIPENGTSSSENATTTTTSSAAAVVTEGDPCVPNPCWENSVCTSNEDNSHECVCNDGYILVGKSCDKGCEATTFSVNNEKVYYDVTPEACGNFTLYPPTNNTINATFDESQVGTTMITNITCNNTCGNNVPGAIGYAICESDGKYSQPTWIDCSVTDPSTNQQLSSAIIATSEPSEVTANTVSETVVVMKEVSAQENIPQETADKFMAVTNNLLRGSGDGAQAEVQSSSQSIIQSVDNTTQNVDLLNAGNGYNSYENVQSDIAMGVTQFAETTFSSVQAQPRATSDQAVYYVINGSDTSNLASTGAELIYGKPTSDQIYISASRAGTERLSFVVYATNNNNALFSTDQGFDILSNTAVFGVTGGDGTVYTMQFPIESVINIAQGASNRYNSNKRLECIRWVPSNSLWSTSTGCTGYAASNYRAVCTCTGSGDYTIRSVTITEDNGLSPGAIVGIVIGCVAGVTIIGGLVYYFMFRKKKHGHNVKTTETGSIDASTNAL